MTYDITIITTIVSKISFNPLLPWVMPEVDITIFLIIKLKFYFQGDNRPQWVQICRLLEIEENFDPVLGSCRKFMID